MAAVLKVPSDAQQVQGQCAETLGQTEVQAAEQPPYSQQAEVQLQVSGVSVMQAQIEAQIAQNFSGEQGAEQQQPPYSWQQILL